MSGQSGTGRGVGIEWIGFAAAPPRSTVGSVDLDDVDSGVLQGPGQPCAVGVGPFHPGDRNDPMYPVEYTALFDCMIDPKTRRSLSEDYAFVRRAQAMGFELWSDLASPLSHTGNYTFEGDIRQRFKLVYVGDS